MSDALIYERFSPSIVHPMVLHHFHRYMTVMPVCAGKDVLDIACGTGYGAALLAQTARTVAGVDIDGPTIEACRQLYGNADGRLAYVQGSVAKIPFPDASFDMVVSFETIEHVDESTQMEFLREIRRVLRPGGLLAMSSPNKDDAHVNEFHVHELEEAEFKAILHANFRKCKYFKQKIVLGSLICPSDKVVGKASLYGICAEDGQMARPCEPDVESRYVIALASDGSLPTLAPSVNLDASGAILDAFVRQNVVRSTSALRTTIDELRAAARATHNRLVVQAEREERMRLDIENRKTREASLQEGIAAHKARAEKLRETVDACKATEASLRERIAQDTTREASLREGIAAHKARAEKLRETVDACKAVEASLRAKLVQNAERADKLRADVESRKAREASLQEGIAAHKARAERLREAVDACKAVEASLRERIAQDAARETKLRADLSEKSALAEAMRLRIVSHRMYVLSPEERRYLRRFAILHPIRCKRLREEMRLIAASPLFDPEYYRKNNADVLDKIANMPLLHFCLAGWQEGRNPSAYFDVSTFADDHRTYHSDENPLEHFLKDKERYLNSYA